MTGTVHQRLKQRDTILVEIDGREVEVYNWVNVKQIKRAVVRPASTEHFNGDVLIGAGDSSATPEAITKWLAEDLYYEFGVDVEAEREIEVIDITDPEVTLL